MNAGLVLYYQKTDATCMALGLAKRLQELGYSIEILSRDKPQPITATWDRHVRHGKVHYQDWLKKLKPSFLIFGEPPTSELVQTARSEGCICYLTCLWEELTKDDAATLHLFDKLICPSRNAQKLLQEKLELNNTVYVPWDPGIPITRRHHPVDSHHIGIYWPITGSQCFHQEPDAIRAVEAAMRHNEALYLTVSYASSMPSSAVKELRQLAADFDDRVELLKNLSWDKEQLLYGRHDLTIWPSLIEGIGLVGLSSIYMGSPVLAFDHPLVGEIIRDGRNGLLVPCNLNYNWLRVPYVVADYKAFGEKLSQVTGDPLRLVQLRESVTHGLLQRRETYNSILGELFA
jgi:glycosyltransferase involved in cell wall biosynthesis